MTFQELLEAIPKAYLPVGDDGCAIARGLLSNRAVAPWQARQWGSASN
jgi:hypothetical protein